MPNTINDNLNRALRVLLKPIAKLLIDQGITHRDFSEAAKEAFVEMALRKQVASGKVNRSRAAIVTGLTRKEVARVISRAKAKADDGRSYSRPTRVLHGWHNDPEYIGPYGVPLDIPYDAGSGSASGPSFMHLVRVYSGDQSPLQMLEELLRVGAVKQLEDGVLKVLRPDFEPASLSPELIERYGDVSFKLLTSLSANIQKSGLGEGIFDRVVISDQPMTDSELQGFERYLKTRGQDFLVEIDNWLTRSVSVKKSVDSFDPSNPSYDSGVAMIQYVVRDPSEKQTLQEFLVSHGIAEESEE
ncbi:MAG: DUF6502 family protein [Pseudomonadota bacterium]